MYQEFDIPLWTGQWGLDQSFYTVTIVLRELQHLLQHSAMYFGIPDDTAAAGGFGPAGFKLRLDQRDDLTFTFFEPGTDHW